MSKRYQGGVLGVGFNPLQAPNAPTIGAATAGDTTVSVAFTAPANVGGSAISTYAVRVSPGNVSATGSSSPISVTGLTNNTTYTFSVAALNSYGPSPYSGTVTATPSQLFVEDVFSTWLYTGNGSTQTITNGINLSGQGGMVWLKPRSSAGGDGIFDTVRGAGSILQAIGTGAAASPFNGVTSFTSTGFSIADQVANNNGVTNVSWTFREAPKFFDIVTWTGNDVNGRQIPHNLGIKPGFIITKVLTEAGQWWTTYGFTPSKYDLALLNTTDAAYPNEAYGSSAAWAAEPTSTTLTLPSNSNFNGSGRTYVAYLFAHDTTSTGIIQCGSYTGTSAAGNAQNLGWEPQWLMVKSASGVGDWFMLDNMRGIPTGYSDACVVANSSIAEFANADRINLTSTGFEFGGSDLNNSGTSYIYIAIRRGPMRTPTVGTSVFSPNLYTQPTGTQITTGFPVDLQMFRGPSNVLSTFVVDRLRRVNTTNATASSPYVYTNTTAAEASSTGVTQGWNNTGFQVQSGNNNFKTISWNFRRAPGFMDEVCYTGTGVARTVTHNLGVAPELMIVKNRTTGGWDGHVYSQTIGNDKYLVLNEVYGQNNGASSWNSTSPTATTFTVGTSPSTNATGNNYVAYLFASCPGVSKVGSYTGTGALQTINCGFTTGARFVLIKRTDSTSDWYVWDSARGISSGNDPYLLLNSTAAEVTGTNYVDTDTTGFKVTAAAPADLNASGGTFIFLAIS